MNRFCSAIAGVFATFLMPTVAPAGIIDDFGASPQTISKNTVGVFIDPVAGDPPLSHPSGVFGLDGYRRLQLNVDKTDDNYALTQILTSSGVWTSGTEAGVIASAQVVYGSTSGQFAALFTNTGTASDTFFRAVVVTADQDVSLTAILTDDGSRTASFNWPDLSAGSVAEALLDSFARSDLAFDFTRVTSIAVTMQGPELWDASLTLLETAAVPEPSSLLAGLAVTGIIGLAAARHRRKQA
jgi:hypothetical protein